MKRLCPTILRLLIALPCATAVAAPVGYSVNSDNSPGDTLHQINLETGVATPIGAGVSAGDFAREDIEGMAFALDGSLWAMDEDQFTLFQVNTGSGTIEPGSEVNLFGITESLGNDFGMTFACDGTLYASSVTLKTLYTVTLAGVATPVGAVGDLGVNISAIAAYGSDPVRIYGLGNGLVGESGPPLDNRSLYEIDPVNGTALLIGDIGIGVADYHQAGLSFDSTGQLWAITDRSAVGSGGLPSQILNINRVTGAATVVGETGIGFESLAVAPPAGCADPTPIDPGPAIGNAHAVPTLGPAGRLAACLTLLIAGLAGLGRRLS